MPHSVTMVYFQYYMYSGLISGARTQLHNQLITTFWVKIEFEHSTLELIVSLFTEGVTNS